MTERIYEEWEMYKLAGDHRNSMSYWWPKIKDLDVNQPRTIRHELDRKSYFKVLFADDDKKPDKDITDLIERDMAKFKDSADTLGYPVFMRTSEVSAKHSWEETCFVADPTKLKQNFWTLIEENYLAIDQIPDAVFFRKFIPMESYFTGWYHNFPINKEVRTFIRDGKVECMHPYWPRGAMEQAKPKDPDWGKKYEKLCILSQDDKMDISNIIERVGEQFKDEGWWSADCAKGNDGVWYLIDMALGPVSAHYFNCPHRPKVKMRDGTMRKDKE